MIFTREAHNFTFPVNSEKKKKEMIAEAVGRNQQFFAIACVMNYKPCIEAMKWFRKFVRFSKDYGDIPKQLLEYAEDANMLQAIVSYVKQADVGIEDMSFEVSNEELSNVEIMRKDQVYFVDKDQKSGVSELFNITDFRCVPIIISVRLTWLENMELCRR